MQFIIYFGGELYRHRYSQFFVHLLKGYFLYFVLINHWRTLSFLLDLGGFMSSVLIQILLKLHQLLLNRLVAQEADITLRRGYVDILITIIRHIWIINDRSFEWVCLLDICLTKLTLVAPLSKPGLLILHVLVSNRLLREAEFLLQVARIEDHARLETVGSVAIMLVARFAIIWLKRPWWEQVFVQSWQPPCIVWKQWFSSIVLKLWQSHIDVFALNITDARLIGVRQDGLGLE